MFYRHWMSAGQEEKPALEYGVEFRSVNLCNSPLFNAFSLKNMLPGFSQKDLRSGFSSWPAIIQCLMSLSLVNGHLWVWPLFSVSFTNTAFKYIQAIRNGLVYTYTIHIESNKCTFANEEPLDLKLRMYLAFSPFFPSIRCDFV